MEKVLILIIVPVYNFIKRVVKSLNPVVHVLISYNVRF